MISYLWMRKTWVVHGEVGWGCMYIINKRLKNSSRQGDRWCEGRDGHRSRSVRLVRIDFASIHWIRSSASSGPSMMPRPRAHCLINMEARMANLPLGPCVS